MAGLSISLTLPTKKPSAGGPPAIPANAILDEDGNPILDEDGNFILTE
jgi:hypothetical protein